MLDNIIQDRTSQKTLEAVERDHIVQTPEKTHWKVNSKNS